MAGVEKYDTVGACVAVFPHRPRKHGGHQENGGGVGDVLLAFGVAQDQVARGAGADQFKRVLVRLIVVDAGR